MPVSRSAGVDAGSRAAPTSGRCSACKRNRAISRAQRCEFCVTRRERCFEFASSPWIAASATPCASTLEKRALVAAEAERGAEILGDRTDVPHVGRLVDEAPRRKREAVDLVQPLARVDAGEVALHRCASCCSSSSRRPCRSGSRWFPSSTCTDRCRRSPLPGTRRVRATPSLHWSAPEHERAHGSRQRERAVSHDDRGWCRRPSCGNRQRTPSDFRSRGCLPRRRSCSTFRSRRCLAAVTRSTTPGPVTLGRDRLPRTLDAWTQSGRT